MSMRSATDTIKQLTGGRNTSGTIPQALDMIQNLQKASGNPKMQNAVGAQNIQQMLSFIQKLFKKKSKHQTNQQAAEEAERLRLEAERLLALQQANTAETASVLTSNNA